MPTPLTLILPYYRQPQMLRYQLAILASYPPEIQIILVDDGSPEPAEPLVIEHAPLALCQHLRLYRVKEDKPWNREMCRNLGAREAQTDWIMQLDLDHVLPAACVPALLALTVDPACWYRFPRFRRGQADETRQKDALPRACTYGPIKPHIDSYLVRRETFWDAGGYDEDFCGVLGGGSEFLSRLERTARCALLPEDIRLEVLTRSMVADASDRFCSRDTAPGKALWQAKQAQGRIAPKPTVHLRLPWERVL